MQGAWRFAMVEVVTFFERDINLNVRSRFREFYIALPLPRAPASDGIVRLYDKSAIIGLQTVSQVVSTCASIQTASRKASRQYGLQVLPMIYDHFTRGQLRKAIQDRRVTLANMRRVEWAALVTRKLAFVRTQHIVKTRGEACTYAHIEVL